MATSSEMYVGIDVSKGRLDVAVLGEERGEAGMTISQDGIAELVRWMLELQPELIVVEATGGYQRSVVDALFYAGLSVAVVNPARVRQFARACGLLAKTDKLDAQVLAVFGQRVQPRHYAGKSEAEKQLSALLVRRKQVEEMLKAEQNRLRTISSSLRGSVERIIAILKEEKKSLDEQIQRCYERAKSLARADRDPQQCARGGRGDHCYPAGRTARNWAKWTARRLRLLVGVAPMNYRQWQETRLPQDQGRAGQMCAVCSTCPR